MSVFDKVLGGIWLLLGIALCLMSYRIGIGEAGSPGSGFMPFLSGCLLIFLSIVNLFKSFYVIRSSEWRKGFWEEINWNKLLWVVVAETAGRN